MKIQKQPNRFSCTATSFAIILGIDVQEIFDELKHDGSEPLWPEAGHSGHRGFHIQEMVDFCFLRGYAVTTVEPQPGIHSPETGKNKFIIPEHLVAPRIKFYMQDRMGVLSGVGSSGGRHSVAWINNQMICPTVGESIPEKSFKIQYFYMVQKVNSGLDV